MAEELKIASGTKKDKYTLLYKQVAEVVRYENDGIALMANVAAMIHHTFGFWWTGFYRVQADELVLGPSQGPLACTRIKYGRGVCGTAWKEGITQVVPDVELFPGHIACSSASRSEIVAATKELARKVKEGEIQAEDIDDKMISASLYTADMPDPDLIIRTSGEYRLSNFLMWQASYAEFYFTDVLWPDFDKEELEKAVEAFSARDRRYGLVK